MSFEFLTPDQIVDPVFSLSLPQSVTVSTGLDALTHAIEAYTSVKAQPLTDPFALSAVRHIFANLLKARTDGHDSHAREQLSLAALEAGIAFNNSSVTLVHGMSRPIGALFHVPHGLSNAMLLSVCLKFALPGAVTRFADLGRAVGIEGDSDERIASTFVMEVADLCRKCEIVTFAEYGIPKEEFEKMIPKMARDAKASGSPDNTRRTVSISEMEHLYKEAWEDKR